MRSTWETTSHYQSHLSFVHWSPSLTNSIQEKNRNTGDIRLPLFFWQGLEMAGWWDGIEQWGETIRVHSIHPNLMRVMDLILFLSVHFNISCRSLSPTCQYKGNWRPPTRTARSPSHSTQSDGPYSSAQFHKSEISALITPLDSRNKLIRPYIFHNITIQTRVLHIPSKDGMHGRKKNSPYSPKSI